MTTENRARASRAPARATAPTKPASGQPAPVMRTWLVLQGDVIDEVQSAEAPDLSTKKGERRKKLLGSATDEATLQKLRDRWLPRARGVTGRGEAV